MQTFLLVQALYQTYEVGLFAGTNRIACFSDDKKYASRDLIPTIQALLNNNNYSISDITACGVNQGPGPFTSVRVIVTTANGLAFATGMPLVGVNNLQALLAQYYSVQWPITIVLLNAFNHDLYFGIQSPDGFEMGCEQGALLLKTLADRFAGKSVRFIGNGVELFNHEIMTLFGTAGFIQDATVQGCSLEQLGVMVCSTYERTELHAQQLLPLYLKNIRYAVQL